MHTSNTLYPSDVCSLSFLVFQYGLFYFRKKKTKNDDYRCVVYIKSELSSLAVVIASREKERIEKPTQYLTLTLSRTLTTPLLIIINWSHIYTYIDIWIFERLTNKSSSSCVFKNIRAFNYANCIHWLSFLVCLL